MKKFLSLVLSLAMTLSLVTISASATEYKDLTDKGEIQYEEAVAVLNKLGIITGYEDGSFKPTGALTRGAAAKIIVSLMIGSDAASALAKNGVTVAPYKDVPVTNTFAAVISYCKTAGYISGYTDGTFRPTAALSGYAFSKMLLGALGYDGVQEGFTGSGWTMNVAKLGNTAGLFNDFATAFQGNATVDRQSACLLALNTLKATEVEYSGGTNITTTTGAATTNVSTQKTRSYKVSNNDKINQNINKTASGNTANYYTLEFGEEHFTDLKLTADGTATDDFGRPSNEWTYKSVKIGTYALTPDYVYTTEASGDTDADKVKDMGLKDDYIAVKTVYDKVEYTTALTFNSNKDVSDTYAATSNSKTYTGFKEGKANTDNNAALLASLCKNGTRVEVYLSDKVSNLITNIVVVKTQMMQVNAVKSSEVTLKKVDDNQDKGNISFMTVNAVKDGDDCYNALKGLKADDYVLVTPVQASSNYDVNAVAIPQVVTGKMTNIATKSSNAKVKAVTVAGTAYKMSDLWTSEDGNLNVDTKLSTSKDATVYLDTYGYAIFVKDVTDTKSAIIIDEIYSSMVDGKIVKYAKGWDSNGTEVSLNLGTSNYLPDGYSETSIQGHTFGYEVSTSNNADYKLVAPATTDQSGIKGYPIVYAPTAATFIKNGAYNAEVAPGLTLNFDANVKFVFVSSDNGLGTDVTGVTVNNGVTEVGSSSKQYNLTYILNKDGNKIVTVVVPNDNDAANTANLLYVQKITGYTNNTDGKRVALFTAYINGEKVTDCQYTKDSLTADAFYTYSKNETTGVYTLTAYTKTDKTTSVISGDAINADDMQYTSSGTTAAANFKSSISDTYFTNVNGKTLSAKNATIIDLFTDDGVDYSSYKEIKDAVKATADAQTSLGNAAPTTGFQISYIYNGSDNAGAGTVSYIFITKNAVADTGTKHVVTSDSTGDAVLFSTDTGVDKTWSDSVTATSTTKVYVKAADSSISVSGMTANVALTSEGSGIYSFTMGSTAVAVKAAITGFKATGMYFNAVAGELLFTVSGTVPTMTDVEKAQFAKTQLESAGYTNVTVSSVGAVTFTKNGFTDTVAAGKVSIDATNKAITLNGAKMIVVAATKYSDIMAGKFVYVNGAATPVAVDTTLVADGASYVDGYYSVILPTTTGAIAGVTYTVTDSNTTQYAKKDATISITITASGTANATTAATLAVTNGTIATTPGNLPGTTVADIAVTNPTTTSVVFTPADTAVTSATSICVVTLTVGADNVTFTFA